MKWIYALCLALISTVPTSLGNVVMAADEPLSMFQLVVLKSGANAALTGAAERPQIIQKHVEHLYTLGAQGLVVAAGPFLDGGDIQGILLIPASTAEQALAIEAADPAVQARIFAMEAIPLMLQRKVFGSWSEPGKFERVYFGFLLRGPNRSQDAKTAEELQRQHIAHMNGQAAQGALIAAGPVAVDSERRGIVVYRVPTLEEARQRAEADPMVKAGRLKVELHPWQVASGAFAVSSGAK